MAPLPDPPDIVLHDVEVDGRRVDVSLTAGRVGAVAAVGELASVARRVEVIDGAGGTLLPGLHDHHLHLLASAAASASIDLERSSGWQRELQDGDARLHSGAWLRAVGYDESMGGPLDRWQLDRLVPARPARVQHRTGMLWVLNSVALAALGDRQLPAGAELDPQGVPTGRFVRADAWLRDHLPAAAAPDLASELASVGRFLASRGVTGVTDMTAYEQLCDLDALARASSSGAIPQHITATGSPALIGEAMPSPLRPGPVKIVLDEGQLPDLDAVAGWIVAAHGSGRPVAVHCVTRAVLAFAIAAWTTAGSLPGDRVEHAAVAPPDLRNELARLGLCVVTQPSLVASRGDRYLADVDADDIEHLWPCGSLIRAGVPTGAGSDAPYGDLDPWRAIAAAIDRRTSGGRLLGPTERVAPAVALGLHLGPLHDPGGSGRRVEPGVVADVCLLDRPLGDALRAPTDVRVIGTWIGGRRAHPSSSA